MVKERGNDRKKARKEWQERNAERKNDVQIEKQERNERWRRRRNDEKSRRRNGGKRRWQIWTKGRKKEGKESIDERKKYRIMRRRMRGKIK